MGEGEERKERRGGNAETVREGRKRKSKENKVKGAKSRRGGDRTREGRKTRRKEKERKEGIEERRWTDGGEEKERVEEEGIKSLSKHLWGIESPQEFEGGSQHLSRD